MYLGSTSLLGAGTIAHAVVECRAANDGQFSARIARSVPNSSEGPSTLTKNEQLTLRRHIPS